MRLTICALLLLLAIASCSKKDKSPVNPDSGVISISLSKDTAYAGSGETGTVNIAITNSGSLKNLQIKRVDGQSSKDWKTIAAVEAGSQYTFSYAVSEADADFVTFTFSAIGLNNKSYDFKRFTIDTRKGVVAVGLQRIARLTGRSLSNEILPNPNNTNTKYAVGGTDLGIMWDMGNGKTGLFFGDTYGNDFVPVSNGGPGNASQWRYNVLGFSEDNNLADGLTLSSMLTDAANSSYAKQVIQKSTGSHTAIPTAAINVGGIDYVHYFDLKTWDGFTTVFSSLYKSIDHGNNWVRCTEVVFKPKSKFTVVAYAKRDGYVYMIGTPSLRNDAPYLCRFMEADILSQNNYQYWNDINGWVKGDESAATAIFDGPVGEASLVYNSVYNTWIYTYLNESSHNIELRTSKQIAGPWSKAKTLVKASEYGGLYGPFIHPSSNGNELYFTMSMWWDYNVYLMKATLKNIL